jgi:hypothetical protein
MAAIQPRLAIGASWNPTTFDGTGILSLCYGDPDVNPPLNRVKFMAHTIPLADQRQVASLVAPRLFRRTGYGVKLRFDIEMLYETNTFPPINAGFPGSHGGADISLDAIASILGRSAGGTSGSAGSPSPPYLFLTTAYQTAFEQWIAVEVDPSAGNPETEEPYVLKTYLRQMALQLVSTQTWNRVQLRYAANPIVLTPSGTASVGASGSGPPYNATITLSAALQASLVAGDALLLLWPPYQWYRFVITSINGARTTITAQSQQPWPSSISNTTYRTFHSENAPFFWMPYWVFSDYANANLPQGFFPMPSLVQIIGGGANL